MGLVHLDLNQLVLVVLKMTLLHLGRLRNHQSRHHRIHMNPVHKMMNQIMVQLLLIIVTADMVAEIQHYPRQWLRVKKAEYLVEREK